ncbi:MAG: LytTR family DNA-binding domain-containing protein [Phenylobacterium sp.]|uniref:LytTR family DNA-binding domain-containing protein n=1 Tax=Phenylobacterium sp. TaxID=1871053 RepID=UPI003BB685E2
MTTRDRSGEGDRDRRGDLLFMGLFMLFAGGVIIVDIFTVLHDRARFGQPVAWWEPTVWEVSSGLVLAVLLPAMLWLIRRWPPRPERPFPWGAVHIAGGLAFSLVHVVAMGLLRSAAYSLVGGVYDALGPLGDWPYELRKDLLIYCGALVCYPLWRQFRARQAPAAPQADILEVRDGARRVFLPVGNIRWVEAAGNYVELHTGEEAVLHRASLAQMERRLAGFVRIHRSRLVSRAAIAEVETKSSGDFNLRLTSGESLAGSRRFRAGLLSRALDPAAAPD